MAWRQIGDKPSSEPTLTRLSDSLMHMCGTRWRWVNVFVNLKYFQSLLARDMVWYFANTGSSHAIMLQNEYQYIWNKQQKEQLSTKNMDLKTSFAQRRPFCLALNMLSHTHLRVSWLQSSPWQWQFGSPAVSHSCFLTWYLDNQSERGKRCQSTAPV